MTRRITYVTGTRADFGLMLPTLRRIAAEPTLALDLVVTGMHLSSRFGDTVREVERSGLSISARVTLPIDDDSGAGMARCGGAMAAAMADLMAASPPDALLVLGDRSEMLAAAFPALLAGVPVVHLCGGERSGTIDDALRHAISRLAHLHLVATEEAAERLVQSGEEPWRVHRVGTPGLVAIETAAAEARQTLLPRYGIDPSRPFALMLFHPVVQDADRAGEQVQTLLDALDADCWQVLCLMPNADHGGGRIRERIAARDAIRCVDHMPRDDYLAALRHAAFLIGNSSSGIIEAASLGTAVINVGDRQAGRARNRNVVDVPPEREALVSAIARARTMECGEIDNLYGDGRTDWRVAHLLAEIDLDQPRLLKKAMTF